MKIDQCHLLYFLVEYYQ